MRVPIIIEREPIQDDNFYPVYKFEGVYEINVKGVIRRTNNKQVVKPFGSDIVLRHPDGDGSCLCCKVDDVWTSTFLHDKALDKYSYVRNIKKRKDNTNV